MSVSHISTHTYLFLFANGMISCYQGIRESTSSFFQLQRYSNDEISKRFTDAENFWREWESNVGYLKNDNIDFAFLSDDENFDIGVPSEYSYLNPTDFFNKSIIKQFMKNLEYNDLSFIYEGGEEKIVKKKEMGYNGPKKFFLNIRFPSEKIIIKQQSADEYTLGEHFRTIKKEEWKMNKS